MFEFFVPLVVVGLAALSILAVVTPPSMASFRAWLRHHQIDIDDHTCALAQVALLKACLVAVLAVVIGAALGFLMELALPIGARWAYGSPLVLSIAVGVATSAVSFPGSPTRRATLAPRSILNLASRRALILAVALSLAVPALSVIFGLAYRSQTRPTRIYPVLSAGRPLPGKTSGSSPITLHSLCCSPCWGCSPCVTRCAGRPSARPAATWILPRESCSLTASLSAS